MVGPFVPSGDLTENFNENNLVVEDGDIIVKKNGRTRTIIDGDTGTISIRDDKGNTMFILEMPGCNLKLGGSRNQDGDLVIFPKNVDDLNNISHGTFHFDGQRAVARFGGSNIPGQIICQDKANEQAIFINGLTSTILLRDTLRLEGNNGHISGKASLLGPSFLHLGAHNDDGDIRLFSGANTSIDNPSVEPTIHLDGSTGSITGKASVLGPSFLHLGANNDDGDIRLYSGANTSIQKPSVEPTIHLNGSSGDIILQNADCAEDFEVELVELAEPGTVMVISNDSRLRVSDQAYDQRVAGIVAGAGKYRPGIILGRKQGEANQIPIALMGRVYCKIDASQEPIHVGDLLTTSSIPGHAMKVSDPSRAFGSVIGKALAPLEKGQSMIPVLVALQ